MKWWYKILIFCTVIELLGGGYITSTSLWVITITIHMTIIIVNNKREKKRNNEFKEIYNRINQETKFNMKSNEEEINNEEIYHKKEFLTDCEKKFMERLKSIFDNKYIIQPQVPLRMIISKDDDELGKYANELHKYIDFGIFDNNYNLLALVELNDKSHKTKARYERDLKVQDICNKANIPLITFWTHGNQTDENIRYFIEKEIKR